jgi:hypothetical protein
MATKKVNIDIIAKDKSRQALQGVRGNLDKLKSSIFNVRNALVGLGGGLVIRSLINTGKEIEGLQVRLKFLFGTAEEGAKAFDKMAEFASRVPFSLEEIQAGSGVLAVVSKDAEELAKNMELTGNVAAVTGLDFKTTAEQIQRSLSAGISAADLFRDRGVKAMLGFQAGAKVSIEETIEAFDRVFGKGGKFDGATAQLAQTFEGTISMLGDKVFNFKRQILEAGFFPELKRQFGDLNEFMEENAESLDKFAVAIGTSLAFAVEGLAEAMKLAKDNTGLLLGIFKAIIATKIIFTLFKIARALQAMVASTTMLVATAGPIAWAAIAGAVTAATATYVGLGLIIDELADKVDFAVDQHKNYNRVVKHGGEEFLKVTKESMDAYREANKVIEKRVSVVENSFSKEMQALNKLFYTQEQKLLANAHKQTEIIKNELANNKNLKESETKRLNELLIMIQDKLNKDLEDLRIKAILDQAKLDQIELDKIKAHEEAKAKIRKEAYSKSLNAIKSRQFQELELEKLTKEQVKDLTKVSGRELLGELSKHNKEMFMLNKAFAIKDAIVSTAQGVSKALALGPFGIPLAVMIGGLGAVQIATIAKQQYTGRQQGGMVKEGQPYMVGEAGKELFVPNQSGKIVPNHDLGKPVNVNFNINTVDARGFNELLVNSRGVIVNMINNAVNEKGRQAII